MSFEFQKTIIPEIILIKPKIFGDSRGFFIETYKVSDFAHNGISESFVQDNHSRSTKGVLRGLHYQKHPMAQAKLVRCTKGSVFDVAVDIRKKSPTYSKWVGVELSEVNQNMIYIPSGFAHGFVVLSDVAEIQYKCTKEYSPKMDRGILWNDPDISIDWPETNPVLSEKDNKQPLLRDIDNDFVI